MKSRGIKSLNRFILILLCVAVFLSSCAKGPAVFTSSEIVTSEITISASFEMNSLNQSSNTSKPSKPTPFKINGNYTVIYPDDCEESKKAAELVARGLSSVILGSVSVKSDYEQADTVGAEILIGKTNRSLSDAVIKKCGYLDFGYKIIAQDKILVYSGCTEKIYDAAALFLKSSFGYEENESGNIISSGKNNNLEIGKAKYIQYDYPVKKLTIDGTDISQFKIYTMFSGKKSAEYFAEYIGKLCGQVVEIRDCYDYDGKNGFFIGCADESGNHLKEKCVDDYQYHITSTNKNVIIDFKNSNSGLAAIDRFTKEYLSKTPNKTVNIKLSQGYISGVADIEGDYKLKLISENQETVSQGVTYSHRVYLDKDEKYVRLNILDIKKGAAYFHLGTADDAQKIGVRLDDPISMSKAAEKNGYKVIAAVNGDYFSFSSFMPSGLCVKNGQELISGQTSNFFAYLNDGTAVISSSSDYSRYKDKVRTGIGGRVMFLKDGMIPTEEGLIEFSETRNPRTAIGIRADGSVVIVEVDGRQSDFSNGASFADLVNIFISLNCIDAINIDGGGSSCMAIKNNSGGYDLKNSPSDGSIRRIADCLIVCKP